MANNALINFEIDQIAENKTTWAKNKAEINKKNKRRKHIIATLINSIQFLTSVISIGINSYLCSNFNVIIDSTDSPEYELINQIAKYSFILSLVQIFIMGSIFVIVIALIIVPLTWFANVNKLSMIKNLIKWNQLITTIPITIFMLFKIITSTLVTNLNSSMIPYPKVVYQNLIIAVILLSIIVFINSIGSTAITIIEDKTPAKNFLRILNYNQVIYLSISYTIGTIFAFFSYYNYQYNMNNIRLNIFKTQIKIYIMTSCISPLITSTFSVISSLFMELFIKKKSKTRISIVTLVNFYLLFIYILNCSLIWFCRKYVYIFCNINLIYPSLQEKDETSYNFMANSCFTYPALYFIGTLSVVQLVFGLIIFIESVILLTDNKLWKHKTFDY